MKNKDFTPTSKQFKAFEDAYKYYNKVLFKNELPDVLLNLSRKSKAMGFAAMNQWRSKKSEKGDIANLHELSINPEILHMDLIDIYSTLVHEMAHIWQFVYGKVSRGGYHNKEWADKMIEVGLMPSSTGAPGGKTTGPSMNDYPIEGGVFLRTLDKMPKSMKFPFICITGERAGAAGAAGAGASESDKKKKIKYSCKSCDANVWGKAGLRIACLECETDFIEND